jgi:hypothetical protein
MIKKVYSSKFEGALSIFCTVLFTILEIVCICALIDGHVKNEAILTYLIGAIYLALLIPLYIFLGNRSAYTVTYNHKEKMLYRKGFFFGYEYQLKVEDIEDVVIGTFPRQGRYYILVDPYNNRYDSCHKKSFIRLQANDKNREFIELFWHRPIIKELPQDTILRNSKIKNFS